MAIQMRRGDYTDFDPTQLLDGELAVVLENDPDTDDGTGFYVSFGDDNVKRVVTSDETADVPIATTSAAGIVKPDGTTIRVDVDGTIHGTSTTPIATTSTAGIVMPDGESIDVDSNGEISVVHARNDTYGIVKIGNTLGIDEDGYLYAERAQQDTPGIVLPDYMTIQVDREGELYVPTVTTSSDGLMTSEDKTKLDGIEPSDTAPLVDGTTSAGSSNEYARADHVHPTDATRMAASLKGAANGVAELDANGKVPSSQLPSFVDDVLEYSTLTDFPATGETGKIYVATTTNETYRWSGSAYVAISNPLDYATQAEAEAGVENTHVMTPLRVKQAIDANAYVLPPATTEALGGVMVDGSTIYADADGTIHGGITAESDGSTAGSLLSLTAKGHAEQDSTTGKNLIRVIQKTSNGVTSTPQSDGSVILSGTSTNESFSIADTFNVQQGVTYCVSIGGYEGTGITDYGLSGFSAQKVVTHTVDFVSGGINIYAPTGTTFNNVRLYPQIELGSTPTDFEPYTGGAPSPSPDYPQEIRVVRGRNLVYAQEVNNTVIAHCESGKTYTFSCVSNYNIGLLLKKNSSSGSEIVKISTYQFPVTFTADEDFDLYINGWSNTSGVGFGGNVHDYQLEEGSFAHGYVPYGSYVGMDVQGKNLCVTQANNVVIGRVHAGKSYTFSATLSNSSVWVNVKKNDNNGAIYFQLHGAGRQSATYTPDEDCNLFLNAHTIDGDFAAVVTDIQLEEGTTATDYEPYYHSTTPIPLPSRGWVAGLPDGTCDTLTLDGAGKATWEKAVKGDTVTLSGNIYDLASGLKGAVYNNSDKVYADDTPMLCDRAPQRQRVSTIPNYFYTNPKNTVFVGDADDTIEDLKAKFDGSTVYYPLATPVTEECGYVDLPEIPEGASVSIPELDDLGVRYHVSMTTVLAEYETRIAALEAAIAELATS